MSLGCVKTKKTPLEIYLTKKVITKLDPNSLKPCDSSLKKLSLRTLELIKGKTDSLTVFSMGPNRKISSNKIKTLLKICLMKLINNNLIFIDFKELLIFLNKQKI